MIAHEAEIEKARQQRRLIRKESNLNCTRSRVLSLLTSRPQTSRTSRAAEAQHPRPHPSALLASQDSRTKRVCVMRDLICVCRRSALSGSSERSTEKEELKRREKEAKEKEKEAKEKEKERKRAEKGTSGGEIRTFLRMIGKGLHSESNSGNPSSNP